MSDDITRWWPKSKCTMSIARMDERHAELLKRLADAERELNENEGVIAVWRRRCNEAERRSWAFGEIMAVLHCDGGHYLAEHGTDKALADAIGKHNEAERERDALRELLREARPFVYGLTRDDTLRDRIDAALHKEKP